MIEKASEKYLNKSIKIDDVDEGEIRENLKKRELGNIEERVRYELDIINNMGYNGYFIIVWDFIKFARENGIYVGPGRGSAAASHGGGKAPGRG